MERYLTKQPAAKFIMHCKVGASALHCRIAVPGMSAFAFHFSPHCCIAAPFSIRIIALQRQECPHCQGLVRKGLYIATSFFVSMHDSFSEATNFANEDQTLDSWRWTASFSFDVSATHLPSGWIFCQEWTSFSYASTNSCETDVSFVKRCDLRLGSCDEPFCNELLLDETRIDFFRFFQD